MIITLKQLRFEPETLGGNKIAPMNFHKGMNFIIGEKSSDEFNEKEQNKMNGVGKSLLVEAINFCLFKDLSKSRIKRIPESILSQETYICLSLEAESKENIKQITIKRSRAKTKTPIIFEDGVEKNFESTSEAKQYLEYLLMPQGIKNKPSLRSLLSILLRDERTSYEDFLRPYKASTSANFADVAKPHLYLFNLDPAQINEIKRLFLKIEECTKIGNKFKKDFEKKGVSPKEVKSYINGLEDHVEKLRISLQQLKPGEGAKQKNEELESLLRKLEDLSRKRASRKFTIEKIKKLPKTENVPIEEIKVTYNQYRLGLGDLIKKSLGEVLEFKAQIEHFQNSLMGDKLRALQLEVQELEEAIEKTDQKIANIYEQNKAKEKITDLVETLKMENEKSKELESLETTYRGLEEQKLEKKRLEQKRLKILEELEESLFEFNEGISSFEKDLMNMHYYIAGNKECHFEINIERKLKTFVEFNYRIKRDGSAGINRIRTFIYDILLMINEFTSRNHPHFLIHDNIFASTGKDDMIKALNYLSELEEKGKNFQYILTINKDEFESKTKEFRFDYEKHIVATFTRENPFLATVYSEI